MPYSTSPNLNSATSILSSTHPHRKTHEEDIYEDLCYVTLRIGRDAVDFGPEIKSENDNESEDSPAPLAKRDYCIRELVETEKNYIEALNMIMRHFVRPCKKILRSDYRRIIFKHIKELASIHSGFHAELYKACISTNGLKLSDVFLAWKTKFIIYGDYCANLPRAQSLIDDLCSQNHLINQSIIQYQLEANDGKFKLRDLLSLPMQRILKYHLLLRELIKNTDEVHDDLVDLQKAYDCMIDIGEYINEVKRDSETLSIISAIQESIVDLNMPENTHLKDYGRLLKDGEVKIKFHEDNRIKSRYVFVFDRVVLMCKSIKGEQYSYKEALILADFEVEDNPTLTPSNTVVKHLSQKWSHSWFLVHIQERYLYTFYVKSEEIKIKWIEALKKALDNVTPEPVRNGLTDHIFNMFTFDKPSICADCDKLLRGTFFQGYKCAICGIAVHKGCISRVKSCGASGISLKPPLPSSSPSNVSEPCSGDDYSLRNSSSDLSPRSLLTNGSNQDEVRVRAIETFKGQPSLNQISFDLDDIILVTNKKPEVDFNEEWWEGKNLRTFQKGLFPADHVDHLDHHSRLISYEDPTNSCFLSFDLNPRSGFETYVNLNLDEYSWFAGTMDRITAQSLLEKLPNSTFLVRISPKQKGNYAISLNCNGLVKHMRICITPNHQFYLSESKYFDSVVELVKWYEERSLAESFSGLNLTLTIPYKQALNNFEPIGYAIAIYSFTGNSSEYLSLRKGDRIAILSKAAEEKGWWKGQIDKRIGFFPLAYVSEIKP